MRILNLYAGIGGNRKLWECHEITAVELREDVAEVYRHYFPQDKLIVGDAHKYLLEHFYEFDFIWTSTPCPSHSRARFWGHGKTSPVYPDMTLYQEIIFLENYFDGLWIVENVKPYYEPLIRPSREMGRHLFWTNFFIRKTEFKEGNIHNDDQSNLSSLHGFDLSKFKLDNKTQVYRNCVHPETGLHILNCALGINKTKQIELFA